MARSYHVIRLPKAYYGKQWAVVEIEVGEFMVWSLIAHPLYRQHRSAEKEAEALNEQTLLQSSLSKRA